MIPLNIPVYERGAAGIPTTTLADDLTGRVDSTELTSSASFGFETMRCPLTVEIEEALDMLARWLMRSTVVYSPDAEIVWEGILTQVDADFGDEQRSMSLEPMANRINVRYTTVLGTPGSTGTLSDTASIALYGTKDGVLSLPGTSIAAAAQQFRASELGRRKNPAMIPATRVDRKKSEQQKTVVPGTALVTLTWAGWYTTLGWVLTSRTDTSSEATTTQVGALISGSSPGIGTTNAFLSTSTTLITASGISDTRHIEEDTTYRQKIEALLGQGDSAGERLAWGVYEDRKFKVTQWAGATPDTVTYRRDLGDDNVYSSTYGLVEPWNVRPNAIYEVRDLLDVGPVATAQDAAARFYVERVTCSVTEEGATVVLEPMSSDSMDARLARLGG